MGLPGWSALGRWCFGDLGLFRARWTEVIQVARQELCIGNIELDELLMERLGLRDFTLKAVDLG